MRVFLSWSGERSRIVAEAIRTWLPRVLQVADPWMSDIDIASGARWSTEIASNLEQSQFGVICVTPENQSSTWINFEAGALSKAVSESSVIPYALRMEPSAITGPMSQFQAVSANAQGTRRLIKALNVALGPRSIRESDVDEIFEVWWPKLEEALAPIPDLQVAPQKRSEREMIEEIITNTREQLRRENERLEEHKKKSLEFTNAMTGDMKGMQDTIKNVFTSIKDNFENHNTIEVNQKTKELLESYPENMVKAMATMESRINKMGDDEQKYIEKLIGDGGGNLE
ncbi:toll/interleukin-1 receptor domain-containing protein [Mesorhizobium sp. M8A.F.Ca.ET.059.01.1.1]|nr:toll/interleukin-1 receptor domain-containing protein [Mesorhizobium sp. M8A.F.Ca.ET.059.01.1.1]